MVIYHSKQLSCHTNLREVVSKLHGYHIPLTWMVTDLECNSLPEGFQQDEPFLISGRELDEIMKEDFQVIWGVLSGFRLEKEEIKMEAISPVAEHEGIWNEDYEIQHPQAECELVSWDSSATFFRSTNQKVMRIFSRKFPEAKTLNEFNKNRC